MYLEILDNVKCSTASVLLPAITSSNDIRIAVAFVSSDGLMQISHSLEKALEAGAYVEFLVGMDTRATDPDAMKELYTLACKKKRVSLLCFVTKNNSAIYHPKMYLAKEDQYVTAIIGSSNLTRRGLTSNIEVNILVKENIHSEFVSEIYSTYNRLKYHPHRVIPDEEFVELFAELCRQERNRERLLAKESELKKLKETLLKKASKLKRPKPRKEDLVGWLELVYNNLPEGTFGNRDIYQYENEFKKTYPHNLNIKAKIRQQLQVLNKLGFIEHVNRGIWRKVEL